MRLKQVFKEIQSVLRKKSFMMSEESFFKKRVLTRMMLPFPKTTLYIFIAKKTSLIGKEAFFDARSFSKPFHRKMKKGLHLRKKFSFLYSLRNTSSTKTFLRSLYILARQVGQD